MKLFAHGFAAFDAETCPQPGDAKIFQLLLDSRKSLGVNSMIPAAA